MNRNIIQKKQTRASIAKTLEFFLWVIGFSLIVFYIFSILSTSILHGKDIKDIETSIAAAKIKTVSAANPSTTKYRVAPDQTYWSKKRINAYQESFEQTDTKPMALLSIPEIDLKVAVLNGTDDITLNRGVGRVQGTAWPGTVGNLALAGHRDGFFRGLKDIKVGDSIKVSSLSSIYEYEVKKISIVQPDDVSVIQPTENSVITLITCYPFYFIGNAPERYIVRASLKSTKYINR